jgi:transposase InsO family protein
MPFKEISKVASRLEFVSQAIAESSNVSELCRRHGITRRTGYKWIRRFLEGGVDRLEEMSRKPHHSPGRTCDETEALVLSMHDAHPAWGARKIRSTLINDGCEGIPSRSTVHAILRRHGRVDPAKSHESKAWKRFEREKPNELWQMDFKGHFATGKGRCHPLTVLDDCSRYCIGLEACGDERGRTVQTRLEEIFRRYGMPDSIITDNGSPFGAPGSPESFTGLGVWLIRLGIRVLKAGEYHPQTNGKVERFHRTLKAEVLQGRNFRDLDECGHAFDEWRPVYNFRRPHEALGDETPSTRYRMSHRSFPETMPEIEYGPDDRVRKVQDGGLIRFRGVEYRVGRAFKGLPVAVRRTAQDGVFDVCFCRQIIAQINPKNAMVPP